MRWYDATNSVFISQDPIGFADGGTNLAMYCSNDPVNYVDPTGMYSRPWDGTDIPTIPPVENSDGTLNLTLDGEPVFQIVPPMDISFVEIYPYVPSLVNADGTPNFNIVGAPLFPAFERPDFSSIPVLTINGNDSFPTTAIGANPPIAGVSTPGSGSGGATPVDGYGNFVFRGGGEIGVGNSNAWLKWAVNPTDDNLAAAIKSPNLHLFENQTTAPTNSLLQRLQSINQIHAGPVNGTWVPNAGIPIDLKHPSLHGIENGLENGKYGLQLNIIWDVYPATTAE